MPQRERVVDSVADPRFAEMFAAARQRWLCEYELEMEHAHTDIRPMRVPLDEKAVHEFLAGRGPSPFPPFEHSDRWKFVRARYMDGMRHLASTEQHAVREAYLCFFNVVVGP